MKKVVIIGGGISGLTAAYLLAKTKEYEVHVVEKTNKLGGLLKSFDYGENGYFDYGAHNILETGIEELDRFYLSLFSEEKWQITTTKNGQIRALTGLIYNKELQQNSPFIDLRKNQKLAGYIGDFFENLNNQREDFKEIHKKDAYSYSIYLFGKRISDEIIVPAIIKLYGRHPRDLNTMVFFLTQFTRIVLFEEHIMKELVHLKNIGSRLSYTEQSNLPEKYLGNFKSLYPSEYGIFRVIDAIEERLKEKGVIFHMNSTVLNPIITNSKIISVEINDVTLNIDHFVSSAGLFPLSCFLGVDVSKYKYDTPPKTVITNILIDRPLLCGELSFIYSYDKESKIFRVDNYINYCHGAKRKGLYPISIESLNFEELDIRKLEEKLVSELKQYNILCDDTNIEFIKTEILEYGFPLLTQNNVFINNELREKIKSLNINNLTTIGILSEEGLFFENEVIKDTYSKIKEI